MRIKISAAQVLFLIVTACCAVILFVAVLHLRPLTLSQLEKKFTPGIHGVVLLKNGEQATFEPWDSLEQNRSLDAMIERLCSDIEALPSCASDPEARFRLFTKPHTVGQIKLIRGAIAIEERDITEALLRARLQSIAAWATENQLEDGSFPYLYHPSSGEYPEGSNIIREMTMVQGLYAAGRVLDDAGARDAAVRAEKQLMDAAYHYDAAQGYAYMVEETGEIKLGAAAVTIIAIREGKNAEDPLSEEEKRLGAFLLAMQREDGSFQTYAQVENTDENDRFYSGEALFAIALLAKASGDEKYHAALAKSVSLYRAKLEADFYPQYAPWHMQAYMIAYTETQNEAYAEYVYWLADRLIETMLEEDRAALKDEKGRFYNPDVPEWGVVHSSSTGIYTEGLTYAYELAKKRGDTARMERYRKAALSGTRSLLTVQWTAESAYYLEHPERVVGAFKRTPTDNRHRIDQIGHAANALARVGTIVVK